MRKNIFLITAFLCIAAVADAQLNTLFEQENPAGFSDVTNVVYANIQGRHYAIYHVRGSGNGERIRIVEFTQYYSGAPLSPWSYVATWDYQVAQDYRISDLAVFGNYLFFCGKKSVGGTPYTQPIYTTMLGWADLNQMALMNNVNFNYREISTNQLQGSHCDKLIAYQCGQDVNIVAIGEKDYPNPGDQTRRFFMIEALFSQSTNDIQSIAYRYLWDDYNSGGTDLEVAHELVKTQNYLAIIGYRSDFKALSIRRCDPNAVLNADMDDIYIYPSTTHDVLSMMKATNTGSFGDKMTIAYLTESYNSYYSTCVREIDLSSMDMIGSQEVLITEKSEPMALKFSTPMAKNILVQSFTFPIGSYYTTNYITLDPDCTTDYMAPVAYRKDDVFSSATLNTVNEKDVIAVSCDYDFFVHDMSYWSAPSSIDCPYMSTIQVKCVNNENHYITIDTKYRVPLLLYSILAIESPTGGTPHTTCESH